ncbi:MAG: Gldg family protein [Balneolaceae bacterium]|nr:Gldg family protein [Balneolaceae bacterium]
MTLFEGFLINREEGLIQTALIIGTAIVLCILANQLIWRADLTEDNRYTLSSASEQIAEQIGDPITVTAYFSEDLPPNLDLVKDEFRSFLDEFRAYSGGNLEYRFVNPNENDQTEAEAQQAGIQPLLVNVRERDQVSQRRAYLGAVFQYENRQETLPAVQPNTSLEYEIALIIQKLIGESKPKIGFLQGHGEPTQAAMTQTMNQLQQLYQVVDLNNVDSNGVPPDIEVLMIVGPEEMLTDSELLAIDQYIMSGGKAVFAINKVNANLQAGGIGSPIGTGLSRLLNTYNIPVQANLLRDVSSAQIQVQSRDRGFNVVNNVRYPYIPMIPNFGDHPISQGIESVLFPFVSTLDVTLADTNQTLSVLARSSERADTTRQFLNLSPQQQFTAEDFQASYLPVAALIEGTFTSAFADDDSIQANLTSSSPTSIVVFGDGDFVINGTGQQQQNMPEDNINIFINAVDYLADASGLMELRTKAVTSRPLAQITDQTKTFLKYLNVLLPIFLVIGYGFYRYRTAQSRRQKWKEEGV